MIRPSLLMLASLFGAALANSPAPAQDAPATQAATQPTAAGAADYGWLDSEEHQQALDWPESLKEIYRRADPQVLLLTVLNSHTREQTPTGNDNFGRPIATIAPNGDIVTVTIRQRYHAPSTGKPLDNPGPRVEENTTNLYLKRSTDQGRTWIDGRSIPHELGGLEPYKWETAGVNWGTTVRAQDWGGYWGRVLGVYEGAVYAGGHEGLYKSEDDGKTWARVEVQTTLHRDGQPMYLAPEMHIHPEAGMVILGQRAQHDLDDTPLMIVATSDDGGVNWHPQEVATGEFRLTEPSFAPFPDDEDTYFVFSRRRRWDDQQEPWSPAQGFLKRNEDGSWRAEDLKRTDIPYAKDDQDTHGVFYNPKSQRFEAAVSYRGSDVGDEHMKVKLYSLSLEDAKANRNHWRYDGTIQDHRSGYGNGFNYGRKHEHGPRKGKYGQGEGQHPAGIAHDGEFAYITFGSGPDSVTWCNSYCVRRTLDTDRMREALMADEQGRVNLATDAHVAGKSDGWHDAANDSHKPLSNLHDGRWDGPQSSAQADGELAWVEYDFRQPRKLAAAEVYGDRDGRFVTRSWSMDRWDGDGWWPVLEEAEIKRAGWNRVQLGDVEARRVRVTFGGDPAGGVQAAELRLWAQP